TLSLRRASPNPAMWQFRPFRVGALALECHSCVDLGDGGCNADKMKKVTCPASSHVCVETVAAVGWSHGKFSVGEKGCGLGMSGKNDKAVEVHGIVAFSQLHQCNSSHCNTELDIRSLELQPVGNESARVANGVECYSCSGNDCAISNSTIVKCYDSFRGCFHGNVTMRAGNFTLTRPIKGCVEDEECTKVKKGSPAITLVGSCCSGSLCNVDLSNKTHFAAKIPQLTVLPGQGTVVTTAAPTTANARINMAAPSAASKPTHSTVVTSPTSAQPDNGHDHSRDHDDDHDQDHDRDGDDHKITSVRDGNMVTAVKVEERHNGYVQVTTGPKGGAAGLGGSVLLLLLTGLLQ
uniref:LY6/PLAUR domain containing 3 n=1 Tax=Varanus komodoensis TaxID=61221 RepID=A0A8D2J4N7_VARKO